MDKAESAFRTIGELSSDLGVPQHILRYWETRFPQLRPLQRAGNRRYYRPADIVLARRIHQLLNVEGYTIKGVQALLAKRDTRLASADEAEEPHAPSPQLPSADMPLFAAARTDPALLAELTTIRDVLAAALAADA